MNLRQGIAAVVVAIAFGCESVGPAGITEPEAQLPLPPPVDPVLPLGLSDLSEACRTGWVEFPDQPVTIWGGSENGVYHRRYEVALPSEAQLVRVASFIGVDAGDLVEADIEIESVRDGARIYQRSLHKDGSAAYDAWDQRWVSYQCGSGGMPDPNRAARSLHREERVGPERELRQAQVENSLRAPDDAL